MNPLLVGVLQKAPEIIAIAKKLVDSAKTTRRTAEITERVSALERNEAQQAELVRDMARQLNDLTTVIKVLNGRVAVCLTCSVLALVLAAAALLNRYAG
jgi:hypothetical protein